MILNADALEVLNFLKSAPGQFVAMGAISRRAGGRRKFEESPGWAKGLMGPLVEAGLIEMNERGHYRYSDPAAKNGSAKPNTRPTAKPKIKIVGDNYFPANVISGVVGDNYFPPT